MTRIKWRNDRPYVYGSDDKYLGTYWTYRFNHPVGVYSDHMTAVATLKLTPGRVQYLMWIDKTVLADYKRRFD